MLFGSKTFANFAWPAQLTASPGMHPFGPFPLEPNLLRFGAVVLKVLLEPIVLQCLMGGNALLRVIDKNLLQ